jgi:hypothetical protein
MGIFVYALLLNSLSVLMQIFVCVCIDTCMSAFSLSFTVFACTCMVAKFKQITDVIDISSWLVSSYNYVYQNKYNLRGYGLSPFPITFSIRITLNRNDSFSFAYSIHDIGDTPIENITRILNLKKWRGILFFRGTVEDHSYSE